MFNEPLGLPQGTVRAIITILLIVSCVVLVFFRLGVPEFLETLAIGAFGFYFGTRVSETTAIPRSESEFVTSSVPKVEEDDDGEFSIVSGKDE